jgi:sugar lactone lactonase YvrE
MRRWFEDDSNHVATHGWRHGARFTRVLARDAGEGPLLFGADGAFGWAEVAGGAGFHFDDDEVASVVRDQVGFGVAGGEAVVASNDRVATAAEEAMGKIFTATAQSVLWS